MPSVAELAAQLDGIVDGNGDIEISGVAGLREARSGEIAFLANTRYQSLAANSRASAILVKKDYDGVCQAALIRVESPDAAFAKVASIFAPPPRTFALGIHPSAVIAETAQVGADVHIGANVVIEEDAIIGDRTVIRALSFIGAGARVGADCLLHPQVSIREDCRLGDRVIIHNGTVVGSDGFGYVANASGERSKIPQIGIVNVEDDVEIGSNCTLDRARFGKTHIGTGVKIDNLVQIAHNVVIGDHAVIVAQVGISGSTSIGSKAMLGGQVGVAGHLSIAAGAMIGAQSGVTKDIHEGAYVFGTPAAPFKKFSTNQANINNLGRLKDRVGDIDSRLSKLENPPA